MNEDQQTIQSLYSVEERMFHNVINLLMIGVSVIFAAPNPEWMAFPDGYNLSLYFGLGLVVLSVFTIRYTKDAIQAHESTLSGITAIVRSGNLVLYVIAIVSVLFYIDLAVHFPTAGYPTETILYVSCLVVHILREFPLNAMYNKYDLSESDGGEPMALSAEDLAEMSDSEISDYREN